MLQAPCSVASLAIWKAEVDHGQQRRKVGASTALIGARAGTPTAAFCLYLRAFSTEMRLPTQITDVAGQSVADIDLEQVLREAIGRELDLVALGHPGDVVGAGPTWTSDAEWQAAFDSLAHRAELIAIIPSRALALYGNSARSWLGGCGARSCSSCLKPSRRGGRHRGRLARGCRSRAVARGQSSGLHQDRSGLGGLTHGVPPSWMPCCRTERRAVPGDTPSTLREVSGRGPGTGPGARPSGASIAPPRHCEKVSDVGRVGHLERPAFPGLPAGTSAPDRPRTGVPSTLSALEAAGLQQPDDRHDHRGGRADPESRELVLARAPSR